MDVHYEADAAKRSQKFRQRRNGCIKKLNEMATITGSKIFLLIEKPNKNGSADRYTFCTDPELWNTYSKDGLTRETKEYKLDIKDVENEKIIEQTRISSVNRRKYPTPTKKTKSDLNFTMTNPNLPIMELNANDFLNEPTSITVTQDDTMTPSPTITSINDDILMEPFDLSTNSHLLIIFLKMKLYNQQMFL